MVHSPGSDPTPAPGAAVLTSYFPALELRAIASHPGEWDVPVREGCSAAVLFADLVGFTALAEALSGQGPRGAEELSRIIDAHFGRFTDIALAAGGDVLAFAGDAVLVAWPADGEPRLGEATRNAAATALKLQELADSTDRGALRMRIAIGAGPLASLRVGGVAGRLLFFATGPAIAQATAAERLVGEGEVVLSPEAAALLGERGAGAPLHGGALRLAGIRPPAAAVRPAPVRTAPHRIEELRPLVPEVIAARVDAGLGEWLGEFRRVTVVFCGLGDLDPAAPGEEAVEQTHRAVRALQTEIARFEGTVYQLLTDDKGTTLVAAFGLPPRAHEDDAARGALAALAMEAALRQLDLAASLGVATGLLYCGVYGTASRRQYTVAGPAVNLAARLMQHADGTVLCDAETEGRARRHGALRFAPVPPIRVKGREQPVVVHRPSMQSEPAAVIPGGGADRQPLGRERECAALDAALDALESHRQGAVVLIEGEPGIGKSCLIEHCRTAAVRHGVRVLACVGDDIEKATAYHAWTEPVRALAGTAPALVFARLGLGPEKAPLLPLLGPILGMDLGGGDSDLVTGMTEEVRAANLRNLLLTALAHLGDTGPAMVTIEDAHWLDSSSWGLLVAAARTIPTLLFVVTSRPPDEPTPDYLTLAELAGGRRLQLQPLEPEAVDRMLARRLGVRTLPDPVLALVRERAAGNPFFSEELGYALRDYGLVTVADGRCELADPTRALAAAFADALASRGLPPTVQGVVTSRIDRLNQVEQFTLKVASVIGRSFPVAMLREVYPVPTTDRAFDATLAALEHLELIRPDPDASEPSFAFRHAITQQVAYDMTLYAQRRDLHRAVGEWLEARHHADQAPVLPLLALHWRRAEVIPKAVLYLGLAGEQAFQNFANAEAVEFFRDALALDSAAPPRLRMHWELQAGRACVNWSRYEAGERHLRRGLALAGEDVPHGNAAVGAALLGQIFRQAVHRAMPGRFVGQRGPERGALLSMARAHEALVEVFYLRDAALPCLESAMRGLNLAELAGPSPELARGYATMGAILGFVPLRGLAEGYCHRALETASHAGDLPATIWTALTVGAYKLGVAAWDEAQTLFDQVTTVSERLGDARRWDDGIQFLTDLHLLQGRLELSLELAGGLYQSAMRRSDPRGQASAVYRRVLCWFTLGRDAEAVQGIEELMGIRWNAGTVHGDLPLCTVRGIAALRTGHPAAAGRMALEAAAMLHTLTPAYHGYVFDAAGTAGVLLQLLERPPAAEDPNRSAWSGALRSALGALRRLARVFPIGRPWLALLKGRAARLRGSRRRALAAWRTAVTLGQRLAMPHPAALAHLELAAWLPRGDPSRALHLEDGRRLLTELGAVHDLRRLQDLSA